jgi:hypothetical protein
MSAEVSEDGRRGGGLYSREVPQVQRTNLDVINDFDEREASERARVVHHPPLTGFTSGVHEVHPLSRLRSSSILGTELSY